MANLNEICELAWQQLFPGESDENIIPKESFIATGKNEFAYQTLLFYWNQKRQEGFCEVPSYLLSTIDMDVKNNEIDISDLKIMKSLPEDFWLQKIGPFDCDCKYVKSSLNMSQLLCDDDSMGDNKTYFVVGNKIRFPRGTHANVLPVIYANSGDDIDNKIEVDGAIGAIIRRTLLELYGGKVPPEDVTNNTNPNG